MADETIDIPDDNPDPKPVTPAPTFVPADDFKQFQSTITGTLESMKESIQALHQGNRAPAVPEAAIDDASDEDIDTALAEGKGAKTFRKLVGAAVSALDRKYDARAKRLEEISGTAIANIASDSARAKMKHYDKPYIKKEVDALLAQLPVENRLNPANHQLVYNAVVGAHMDEIVKEESEAAVRAANNKSSPTPGGSSGRANESPTDETVKDVFGEESERELRARGRSIDSLAKAFGFKDGKEYMKAAKQNDEGAPNNG